MSKHSLSIFRKYSTVTFESGIISDRKFIYFTANQSGITLIRHINANHPQTMAEST